MSLTSREITSLHTAVRMVPEYPSRGCLESVVKFAPDSNGTLCNKSNSIHPWCIKLEHTMPVDSYVLISQIVFHIHYYCLVLIHNQDWTWKLTVHCNNCTVCLCLCIYSEGFSTTAFQAKIICQWNKDSILTFVYTSNIIIDVHCAH